MSFTYDVLEKCTLSHFYKLYSQNIQVKNWESLDLWCLPINRTYEIGGSQLANFKQLIITAMCKTANCKNQSQILVFEAYTLNTFVNSDNKSYPFTSYTTTYVMTVETNRRTQYSLYLDKNTLKTDSSLLPLTQESTLVGFQTSSHQISYSYPNTVSSYGSFTFAYSGTNVVHKRYFLKLLDAFAYLGGVFSALLGAFFFMTIFSTFFFEIEFAEKLLKKSKLQNTTFITFFTQAAYSILAIFKQPEWQTSKYISQLRTTVNNLLDIVYLQRRLQFLEKGMEVLFEKHQLKGLYLVHQFTKEGVDANFQNFEINSKFSQFLREKSKSTEENNQKFKDRVQSAHNLMDSNQQILADNPLKSDQNIEKKGVLEGLRQEKRNKKDRVTLEVLSQQIGQQKKEDESEKTQSLSMKEEDINDLLKLCRQAKEKTGETSSRKIYEKIDDKMKEALQEMLKCELPKIRTVVST